MCFPIQLLARDFERVGSEKKQREGKTEEAGEGGSTQSTRKADFVLLSFEYMTSFPRESVYVDFSLHFITKFSAFQGLDSPSGCSLFN